MFQDQKLSTRLTLGFSLVLGLLVLVAGIGVQRMAVIEGKLEDIVDQHIAGARLAVAMRIAINQVATESRNMVMVSDAAVRQESGQQIRTSRQRYDEAEAKLVALLKSRGDDAGEELKLVERVAGLRAAARPLTDKVIELATAGHTEDAATMLISKVAPAQKQWLLALGELADWEYRLSDEAAAASRADYDHARMMMLGVSALALVLGAVAAVLIGRSIVRQLGGEPGYAVATVQRIAEGDLATPITLRAGDDRSLLAAMARMQQSLSSVIEGIRSGADGVSTASGQIASGNADLSQRTEEQAGNLQQTAASVEQLTSTVRNSADTAQQATQLATAASTAATQGGQVVERVVATMADISQASKRIADIIATIDGIAFQTNILALNAAVEAARAGEQGRGFAVVAGEVRTLASRSADAAKEIKSLIGASVDKVEHGHALVAEAGQAMAGIVQQVQRVSDLIGEISAAAQEQTSGIGQINDAVTQLDQVTQQNAALVEESAAAADSLRQQASKLAEAVAVFRTSGRAG